jgi:hypothetical protein
MASLLRIMKANLSITPFLQFLIWSHRGDWREYNSIVTPLTYVDMCTKSIEAPLRCNILAAFYSWVTLAGFLVFPTTFTSPQYNSTLENIEGVKVIEIVVQRLPLLGVAITCCISGILGTCILWYLWRKNFVWLRGMFW